MAVVRLVGLEVGSANRLMLATGLFEWDVAKCAEGLQLPSERLLAFFKDGRRFAWLLEESLAARHDMVRQGETDDFDLQDAAGRRWEVRCCTKGGLFFCPSNMVGKGRKFNFEDWVIKQANVSGWIVADINTFPRVPYWVIPGAVVGGWWNAGALGPSTHVRHTRFRDLISAAVWEPVAL
jgi:hypothetical protein